MTWKRDMDEVSERNICLQPSLIYVRSHTIILVTMPLINVFHKLRISTKTRRDHAIIYSLCVSERVTFDQTNYLKFDRVYRKKY
jgi:hypothetical protein